MELDWCNAFVHMFGGLGSILWSLIICRSAGVYFTVEPGRAEETWRC